MMRPSVLFAGVLLLSSFACGDEPDLPAQYKPFQGRWKVIASVKVPPIDLKIPEIYVDVVGRSFVLHGPDVEPQYRRAYEYRVPAEGDKTPYQSLHDGGIGDLADIVDTPNQIIVFWFIGIHRFVDDRFELCLRYCGQGIEGEAARTFRPPTTFDGKSSPDTGVITLKRVPVDGGDLLTKESLSD